MEDGNPREASGGLSTTTTAPLAEYHLRLDGNAWTIMHMGALISFDAEQQYLSEKERTLFGLSLWPAAIALAHDLVARGRELRGKRIIELGAGTGLPGIVAATYGARVVQTDRQEDALKICRENGALNRAAGIEYRVADWATWDDTTRYDFVIGADILYSDKSHAHLRHIFDTNLAPGGRLLIGDPFRSRSYTLLEAMEADGWTVAITKWTVSDDEEIRPIGVFELTPPRPSSLATERSEGAMAPGSPAPGK
ncbi:MAG TPA: methyltransferase domain-containing protein [Gemmatimonadaceae bacterium]|nr:methyltransferase domain-containing protein [Gemmatimonadaceae bacterium]